MLAMIDIVVNQSPLLLSMKDFDRPVWHTLFFLFRVGEIVCFIIKAAGSFVDFTPHKLVDVYGT